MKKLYKIFSSITLVSIFLGLTISSPVLSQSFEGTGGKISLTFDDALLSTYTNALPILTENDISASLFVPTNVVGKKDYMSWDQIRILQNEYNWEVGSHTVNHSELPLLSTISIVKQLSDSKSILQSEGLSVSSIAFPYGAYNNTVLKESAKLYNIQRGFWDRDDLNIYPYQRTLIKVKSVDRSTSVSQVCEWVNQAAVEKKWLVLVLHEVQTIVNKNYMYATTTSDLEQIVLCIKNSTADVVKMDHTLQKPGINFFTESSFEGGLPQNWSTDNPSTITLDSNNNGSFPFQTKSISVKGSRVHSHLFSDVIDTNINSLFELQIFINANELTTGELGFYIDEYNKNSQWISGQWLGKISPNTVTHFTDIYSPTSEAVYKFKLQTYITSNSQGTAYIDNYELYNLSSGTPHGSDPIPVDMLSNGDFEVLTADWANDWARDNQTFTIDQNSQGYTGSNSVHLVFSIEGGHLFSKNIDVVFNSKYIWKQYLKVTYTSGEFGFYIDEYNNEGEWISGQWKGEIKSNTIGEKIIEYSPSSSNVDHIRLQYYLVGNSDINLFLDTVSFSK